MSRLERLLVTPVLGALLFALLFVGLKCVFALSGRRFLLIASFVGAFSFGMLTFVMPHDGFYWVWPTCALFYALAWFIFDYSAPRPGAK